MTSRLFPYILTLSLLTQLPLSAQEETLEAKAARIHREAIVVDGHADTTPYFEDETWNFFERHADTNVDYPRILEGGLDAQFWSIWMGETPGDGKATKIALKRIDAVHELVRRHPDRLGLARTEGDVRKLHAEGKLACLMGVEGGHIIENELATLRTYFDRGVRYMTLTHSFHNELADSAGYAWDLEPRHGGLSERGREVVREMNRLGMMVDISHVSKQTFWDVLGMVEAPVIASHSSCAAINPHPRNLDDDQLRALARNGGVIQINFFPVFIDPEYREAQQELGKRLATEIARLGEKYGDNVREHQRATDRLLRNHPDRYRTPLSTLIDHFDHAIRVAGPDHVGIGSDFDGVSDLPEGMEDCSMLPRITYELLKRGHSEETLKKVLGGNVLRVLRSCEETAWRLQHADRETFSRRMRHRARVDAFLATFDREFQAITTRRERAHWAANVEINDENEALSVAADREHAAFLGNPALVREVRTLRAFDEDLSALQRAQLDAIWRRLAQRPGTLPGTVDALIQAEAAQTATLYGFHYRLDGEEVGVGDLDHVLRTSNDLDERLHAWESSKAVGRDLKPGLLRLRDLRNEVAREMGYRSFFHLQVDEYGMSVDEMMESMRTMLEALRPLYRELHTFARYTLAARYGEPVPDLIPAHWLPNRWGQNWPGLVQGVDLEGLFATKEPEWVIRQAERFYVSLGFDALPASFWALSDLYPATDGRLKNTHASAWHLDLDRDVRCLMSIYPGAESFQTTHHELGHVHYFLTYAQPAVPLTLREGANRAFHEGIGDLISIAAMQRPYLKAIGLLLQDTSIDEVTWLLDEALSSSSVAFLPFAAGTMTHFEKALYEDDLDADRLNATWWELTRRFQGIEPPTPRGEEFCDAATKTHVNDDPAQYYDYALACLLKYHFHDHIARTILKQDPHSANYYGDREVGDFLKSVMAPGATRDWRALLRETTGSDLDARAMLAYFAPLLRNLRLLNRGRRHTLPD